MDDTEEVLRDTQALRHKLQLGSDEWRTLRAETDKLLQRLREQAAAFSAFRDERIAQWAALHERGTRE